MIFNAVINPRDFDGYFGMIAHLQTECLKKHHASFDTTSIKMGQVDHNSEMCWFEGDVKDSDIPEAHRIADGSTEKLYEDPAAIERVINVNIQTLGTFHITSAPKDLAGLKEKVVTILLTAVNEASLSWGK